MMLLMGRMSRKLASTRSCDSHDRKARTPEKTRQEVVVCAPDQAIRQFGHWEGTTKRLEQKCETMIRCCDFAVMSRNYYAADADAR